MSDELLTKYVEEKLSGFGASKWDDEGWDFWAWESQVKEEVGGLGTVTTVEQFGGEGQGDRAWIVLKVEFENGTIRYYKKDGYHASHDGTYYDGYFSEVTPQEKVVTVYE
jgi:hypothetical protein